MAQSILVVSDLKKTYTVGRAEANQAVSGVDLEIKAGECVCLLGPNGAGKTTTIMMILGFLQPSGGQITVCSDSVITHQEKARSHISYIPDEVSLYPSLTAYDNLHFFDELLATPKRSKQQIEQISAQIGLYPDALKKKVSTFSKGMKQRLGIAVALLKDSSLFIFDEPTNGLDAVGIREFIQIVATLKGLNKGILVTTHDLLRVKSFATQVVFLRGGKIKARYAKSDLAGSLNLEAEYLKMIDDAKAGL
ncbi:MAG: ABC transporter ATP-binding protein [Bdellovibrionales bacterium]